MQGFNKYTILIMPSMLLWGYSCQRLEGLVQEINMTPICMMHGYAPTHQIQLSHSTGNLTDFE
jgi:hypothetical protein